MGQTLAKHGYRVLEITDAEAGIHILLHYDTSKLYASAVEILFVCLIRLWVQVHSM